MTKNSLNEVSKGNHNGYESYTKENPLKTSKTKNSPDTTRLFCIYLFPKTKKEHHVTDSPILLTNVNTAINRVIHNKLILLQSVLLLFNA